MKVVLKCVFLRLGGLSVIDHGQRKMLQLFANSLDSLDGVSSLQRNYLQLFIFISFHIDAVAHPGGRFQAGTGPIWGTNVVCTSEEGRLVDCGFSSDTSACTHSNDAGVVCNVTGEQ